MRFLCTVSACIFLLAAPLRAQQSIDRLQYQSPSASATLVSRQASIILRPGPVLAPAGIATPSLVEVRGAASGLHRGRTLLSDDRRTVQFIPDRPFDSGERVSVVLNSGLVGITGEPITPRSFSFTVDTTPDSVRIHARIPGEIDPETARRPSRQEAKQGAAVLSSAGNDLPQMVVTALDNPAPGRLYLASLAFSATVATTPHLMILDNAARPVFRHPMSHPGFDFKRQPDGMLSYFDDGLGLFVILDSSYRPVRTVGCGNGYVTDPHELLVLPDGHFLLLGISARTMDMSTVIPDGAVATVLDIVIQELDTAENVVFEWRSVDHFKVTDATHENLLAETIDHVHPNSLEIDRDGNILMSSRHMDEVTKIDRISGEIIWRMGGKNNQFTFTNDPEAFSYQHDARRLANGNILLFDNGNFHTPRRSRAVEYQVDEIARTATVVWQYSHSPVIYSYAMGNAQRLPNGNTVIGWGAYPLVTEVHPDGSTAFELELPPGVFTYRAFRLPAATADVRVGLIAPAEGTTDLPAETELLWESTGGADSYRVEVASDSGFQNIVDDTVVSGVSVTMGSLADWTRFWWRVKATGSEINGVWSEQWSFHTGGAPVYQILAAPPQGARELAAAPALHWEAFPGAGSYEIQLSNYDVMFTAPLIDTTMGSTYLWLDSIASSRFYWRVRPVIAGAPGNWSQIWDFQTSSALSATLPVRLVPLAPIDGADLPMGGDLRFLWADDGSGFVASAYRIEVAGDPAFTSVRLDSTLEASTLSVAADILPAGRYWWRVRATDSAGGQYGSPLFTFDLSPTLGIVQGESEQISSLHPNPAAGSTLLRFSSVKSGDAEVHLTDHLGRRVATPYAGALPAGSHAISIPLVGLPNGVYLCVVSTAGGTRVHRLVIAR